MLIQANAIHIPLPDGVVQTIVTSPPYWAKRAYVGRQQAVAWPGVEFDMPGGGLSFPGDPHCAPPGVYWLVQNGYREPQHDWGDELPARPNTPKRDHAVNARGVKVAQGFGDTRGQEAYRSATSLTSPTMGQFCRRCGAWRGALGHEPDPLMFIGHLVLFLRQCWRVLRPDGTLWLNVADSSHGSWGNYGARRGKVLRRRGKQRRRTSKRWQRLAYEGQHGYKALPPTARPGGPWKAKDQASIPEMLKLAAQYEGWTCRSTIVWAKTNPGPESVKDRPTNVHEFVYLFAKRKRYYYDRVAIQEPTKAHSRARAARRERLIARTGQGDEGKLWQQVTHGDGEATLAVAGIVAGRSGGGVGAMRNKWSVWRGPTANVSVGHFATFPEWLARTMILAGSPPQACAACRAPFERVTVTERGTASSTVHRPSSNDERTVGWRPTCACHADLLPRTRSARKRKRQDARDDWRARASASTQAQRFGWPTVPALVLDPFAGSGTTGKVAMELGRRPVLLDVSRRYLAEFAALRTAVVQMQLFDVEVRHPGLVEYTERRGNGRRGGKGEAQARADGTQSREDGVQYQMALEVGA